MPMVWTEGHLEGLSCPALLSLVTSSAGSPAEESINNLVVTGTPVGMSSQTRQIRPDEPPLQCLLGTLLRQSQDIFRSCISSPEPQQLPGVQRARPLGGKGSSRQRKTRPRDKEPRLTFASVPRPHRPRQGISGLAFSSFANGGEKACLPYNPELLGK